MTEVQVDKLPQCDTLIFFATSSEENGLKAAAQTLHIPFKRRSYKTLVGTLKYFDMGYIGNDYVFAVRTKIVKHPKLSDWEAYIKRSDVADAQIKIDRPHDALWFGQASIVIDFYNHEGKRLRHDKALWDAELNEGLVRNRIRAENKDDEIMRFTLALRAVLHKPEIYFGNGLFNLVIIHVVKDSGFAESERVADVLKHIHRPKPNKKSHAFDECVSMINSIFREQATDLTNCLSYTRPQAESILASAIAQYLDERFSVTNRIQLGFA